MSSYFFKIDYWLWGSVVVLCAVGLVAIASAAPQLVLPQTAWIIMGAIVAFACCLIDFRPLTHHRALALALYGVAIVLLVATQLFGPVIRGTRAWLVAGPFQLQTSEFAKVALIVVLSYFFARRHVGIAYLGNICIPLCYAAIPVALILAQPDMGSAMIVVGLLVGYFFVSGIRARHIIIGIVLAVAMVVWGWSNLLANYQKERIIGLLYPERDPLGANYNVIQSKIAIGSGGWLGKGFQQGTQAQLGFLPEAHNDFIFATIIEEWGIVGGAVVVGAMMILLLRIAAIGLSAQHNFARLLCLGAMIVLLLHVMFNVGSATGLLPVVGVPLSLVSYGGSNIIAIFLLIGIIQSIALRESF